MSDLALAFSLTAAVLWYLLRPVKQITTSEWLERMRKLGLGTK